jgi:glycosyltransferase involved in cell wall biosynthesis
MRIVFFNRFFYPDISATSQMLTDLAFHLAGSAEVHVVTSAIQDDSLAVERVKGVTIHRVARAAAGPHGLLRRAWAYGRYYLGARSALRRIVRPGDIVVAKTDPPLLSVAIGPLAKAKGAKLVVWLQDLFPEVAEEYGVPGMGGALGARLRSSRNHSLSVADAVVAIGERMAARVLESRCVDPERLHVIHNWADGKSLVPLDHGRNELRARWGLQDKFVVGYSGNLGRVHEFDTLLGAASRLRDEPGMVFMIIGRGPRLAYVRERVAVEKLANVRFQPLQERDSLLQSLNAVDVHISILRPGFEGLVVPSKVYGIMAVGRPAIFVGDPAGETAGILRASDAGVSVAVGDQEALVRAILQLRDSPSECARLGENARKAFEARYEMRHAFAEWDSLLGQIAPGSTSAGTSKSRFQL